jgi:hypothetical protein
MFTLAEDLLDEYSLSSPATQPSGLRSIERADDLSSE